MPEHRLKKTRDAYNDPLCRCCFLSLGSEWHPFGPCVPADDDIADWERLHGRKCERFSLPLPTVLSWPVDYPEKEP
jgi:hypothetical protein